MNTSIPTVAFLTATPVEYQTVMVHLKSHREPQWDNNKTKPYAIGEYLTPQQVRCRIIVRQLEEMSHLPALNETTEVITDFQPNYLFFVGIAAKLSGAELGDVVATMWAKNHEIGKVQAEEGLSGTTVSSIPKRLSEMARHLANSERWLDKIKPLPIRKPNVLVTPSILGETEMDSPELEDSSVTGMVIRGISHEENKAQPDKHRWQKIAARHATAFAFALLEEWLKTLLPAPSPYPGLQPFRREEAKNFFGRTEETQELLEKIRRRPLLKARQHPLVVLIGANGSGKSSLVQAGLLPALEAVETNQWVIQLCRLRLNQDAPKPHFCLYKPGETEPSLVLPRFSDTNVPLSTTIKTLLEEHGQQKSLLMIVDQFEELYTLTSDKILQRRFVYWLLEAVVTALKQPDLTVKIVLTLRADFVTEALEDSNFAKVLDKCSKKMLGPITTKQHLREVIEGPALHSTPKVTFEKGLTDLILRDLQQSSNVSLPLLQFTLNHLWEQQTNLQLTHAIYKEMGGIKGALLHYANEVYEDLLNSWPESAFRHIFVQLVQPSNQTHSKRVATFEQIGQLHWKLVEELANAQLVVTKVDKHSQQKTVELVHESLISQWGRLRNWIDQEREFQGWQEKLAEEAKRWEVTHQDAGLLLRGTRLDEAAEKMKKYTKRLSPQEKIFIEASGAFAGRRERDTRQREREWREQERIQLRNLHILAVSLTMAVAFGIPGWWQWGKASQQRDLAQQREQVAFYQVASAKAEAQAIDASAQFQAGTGELSALLSAMQAGQKVRTLVKENGLEQLRDYPTVRPLLSLQTILSNISEAKQFSIGETVHQSKFSMDMSPDGKLIAIGGTSGKVWLFDLAGHEVANWQVYPEDKVRKPGIRQIKFSPDGKWLVTSVHTKDRGASYLYHLWNTDGKQITLIDAIETFFPDINFSPNGRHLVGILGENAFEASVVRIWNLSGQKITQVIFNPDKTKYNETTDTGPESVQSVDYTPNGKQLVMGSDQGRVQIYNLAQQRKILQFRAHGKNVSKVVMSPDGQYILTMGLEETEYAPKIAERYMFGIFGHVKLWDMTGKLVAKLDTAGIARNMRFSPDSRRIMTVGDTVEIWNLAGKRLRQFKGHFGGAVAGRFSPDGKQIVTVGYTDNTLRFWNVTSPSVVQLATYSDTGNLAFSQDNQQMMAGSREDDKISVYNLSSGQPTTVGKGASNIPLTVTRPTPDGNGFVKFEEIPIFDEKYKNIHTPKSYPRTARVGLYDKSGQLLAELKTPKVIEGYGVVYFLLTRRDLGNNTEDVENDTFSLSHDGRVIATLGKDDKVRIWDLANQRILLLKDPHERFVDKFFKVLVSPDGKYLSTLGTFDSLSIRRLWDSASGKPVASFVNGSPLQEGEGMGIFQFYRGNKITVSKDSPAMQAGLKDGDFIKKIDDKRMSSISADPDSLKCQAGEQKTLQVERYSEGLTDNIETLEFVVTCDKFSFRLPKFDEFAQFTPNSQSVVTWNATEKLVRLWNLQGELVTDKIVGKDQVKLVFPSCDSQLLGVIESSGLVELWDLAGNKLSELTGQHDDGVFSCDNQRIATLGTDKKVRVWDVTGRQLAQFDNFEFQPWLAFTPNGKYLATSANEAITLLPITELDELLGQGCYWLKDYLAFHTDIRSRLSICQDPSVLAGLVGGQ